MSLADWERAGWLTSHSTSRQEIADLLAVVERDLADSAAEAVSPDWQLNIAYNAALQAAKTALAAAGYRASRQRSAHYRTIESLRLTYPGVYAAIAQHKRGVLEDHSYRGGAHRPDARGPIQQAIGALKPDGAREDSAWWG